jgi:hypothetical protein
MRLHDSLFSVHLVISDWKRHRAVGKLAAADAHVYSSRLPLLLDPLDLFPFMYETRKIKEIYRNHFVVTVLIASCASARRNIVGSSFSPDFARKSQNSIGKEMKSVKLALKMQK